MKNLFPVLVFCALAVPNTSFGQSAEFWVGGGTSTLQNKGIGTLDTSGRVPLMMYNSKAAFVSISVWR